MPYIYRAEAPHRCGKPVDAWSGQSPVPGSVWECGECGSIWVSRSADVGRYWDPLRSWPFDRKARRLIKEYRNG